MPFRSPTGSYNSSETLRILAFRLFSHAEIESFLEMCAESIVVAISAKHQGKSLASTKKAQILLHLDMAGSYPPRSINYRPHPKDDDKIKGFLNGHLGIIAQNNGATEKDVIKLLTPIGFELHKLDKVWLASMQLLGKRRGEVAHHSAFSTTTQPTPEDERAHLVTPLWGLRSVASDADLMIGSL